MYEQLGRGRPHSHSVAHRSHETDIGRREGVRFAEFAHRDVLGCPLADPRQRPELSDRFVQAPASAEDQRIGHDRGRQRGKRRPPGSRHPESAQICPGQLLRRREHMGETQV